MNQSQVFQRDLIFFCSLPLLGPFITFLRGAPQIDNLGLFNLNHWFKTLVKRFENLVFTLIHVTKFFHDLRENIFVSQDAPFWDFDFLRVSHDGFMKFLNPSEDGIDLEGESPSLRFRVVFLEHVNALSSKVLPIRNRFFYPLGLRYLLPEDLKEGGFPTSNVSFDGETVISCLELRVKSFRLAILIQTSR